MSVAGMRYAIDTLRADKTLTSTDAAVFLAVAGAAHRVTHDTYSGVWLGETVHQSAGNVWRHLRRLRERGHVAVEYRPGKAARIVLPLAPYIALKATAGRTDEDGQFHHARCTCPDCLELVAEA